MLFFLNNMDKEQIENRIKEIEFAMEQVDFWNDKNSAQSMIRELQDLKEKKEGVSKYDKGNSVLTIIAGAGGDDAEDFAFILVRMYEKFCEGHNFQMFLKHKNENDHGGYRNITFSIIGKNSYGFLKHESGVHRLVRLSPFNADQKRHTSFALVEVIPEIAEIESITINPSDLKVELSKSSGPGGQNVNKRETAVRVVHIPTGLASGSDGERTQEANKEQAMKLLIGKLIKKAEDEKKSLEESMQISKTTDIEWGNQIRSYVLHPYKMVKDHRTGVETSQVDKVLEEGAIEDFIEAVKNQTI